MAANDPPNILLLAAQALVEATAANNRLNIDTQRQVAQNTLDLKIQSAAMNTMLANMNTNLLELNSTMKKESRRTALVHAIQYNTWSFSVYNSNTAIDGRMDIKKILLQFMKGNGRSMEMRRSEKESLLGSDTEKERSRVECYKIYEDEILKLTGVVPIFSVIETTWFIWYKEEDRVRGEIEG